MGKARASTSSLAAPRPRAKGASPGHAGLQSEALQADEDRIALRATRSILDAAAPVELLLEGAPVEVRVERLPDPGWPARAAGGLDEAADGPWPRAVRLDCRWRHGRAALLLSAALERGRGGRRRVVGLRVAVQATDRSLVWINIPPAVRRGAAGGRVGVAAPVRAPPRGRAASDDDAVAARHAALRGALIRSGLPLATTSRVEAFGLLLPEGDVLPLPSSAFARIVHLALLELPFFAEGIDGRPPFDIAALSATASHGDGRRRARLFPMPGGVDRFKGTLDWLLAWIRGARPTVAAFRDALAQRHDVTGRVPAGAYLRLLEGAGLVCRRGGALEPTRAGEVYSDAPDPAALFERLHAGYAGLLELLTLAGVPGVAGSARMKPLLEGLLERTWRTPVQVLLRRSWLLSLGLLERAGAGEALTPLGRRVLAAHADEVAEIRKRVEDLLADERTADVERAEALATRSLAGGDDERALELDGALAAKGEPASREELGPREEVASPAIPPPPGWDADRLDLTPELARPHLGALELPAGLLERLCAALSSGKHVLLAGPPGAGKTEIALALGRAAEAAGYCRGALPATASADWTTFETVGGYALQKDGALRFRPGVFVAALEQRRWLLVDELNRADVDRALGELMTVLAGRATTTPYALDDGRLVSIGPDAACSHRVPRTFRVLATMNTWDRGALSRLSYALQRRFAVVHVGVPDDGAYARLLLHHATQAGAEPPLDPRALARLQALLRASALLSVRPVGPAIAMDMIHYARRRGGTGDGLAEAAGMLLLPQLEGLEPRPAAEAHRLVHVALRGLASPGALAELTARFADLFPHARLSAT